MNLRLFDGRFWTKVAHNEGLTGREALLFMALLLTVYLVVVVVGVFAGISLASP